MTIITLFGTFLEVYDNIILYIYIVFICENIYLCFRKSYMKTNQSLNDFIVYLSKQTHLSHTAYVRTSHEAKRK